MGWIARFWSQPGRRYRSFQIVFSLLTLNFLLPSLGYVAAPEQAVRGFLRIGALLWQAPYPKTEDSYLWRFLGASDVFTLGVMCLLLQIDLRRYYPILPALVVLKGATALQFLVHFAFVLHHPSFLVVALWDGVTCVLFVVLARGAHREASARAWRDLVPTPRSLV
jgi:hypothetical protein